jgi:hypothetical protein
MPIENALGNSWGIYELRHQWDKKTPVTDSHLYLLRAELLFILYLYEKYGYTFFLLAPLL